MMLQTEYTRLLLLKLKIWLAKKSHKDVKLLKDESFAELYAGIKQLNNELMEDINYKSFRRRSFRTDRT